MSSWSQLYASFHRFSNTDRIRKLKVSMKLKIIDNRKFGMSQSNYLSKCWRYQKTENATYTMMMESKLLSLSIVYREWFIQKIKFYIGLLNKRCRECIWNQVWKMSSSDSVMGVFTLLAPPLLIVIGPRKVFDCWWWTNFISSLNSVQWLTIKLTFYKSRTCLMLGASFYILYCGQLLFTSSMVRDEH